MDDPPPAYTPSLFMGSSRPLSPPPQYGAAISNYTYQAARSTVTPTVLYTIPLPVSHGPPPSDYWGVSLISMFCFLPIGLVAYRASRETRRLNGEGRFVEAYRSSKAARNYTCLSCCIGIFFIILCTAILILLAEVFSCGFC